MLGGVEGAELVKDARLKPACPHPQVAVLCEGELGARKDVCVEGEGVGDALEHGFSGDAQGPLNGLLAGGGGDDDLGDHGVKLG